jgi:uncharacterized FlaG/YvyC family protein
MSANFKADVVVPTTAVWSTPNGQELLSEQRRIVQAVHYLNKAQLSGEYENKSFAFSIDPSANHTVVKVMDRETGDVLYQIPPEQFLRFAADVRRKARDAGGSA